MMLHARQFQGDADVQHLTDLATRAALTSSLGGYCYVGDVWWGLYKDTLFDPQENIRLWFDQSQCVGFAWYTPPSSVSMLALSNSTEGAVVESAMLEWAEERRRTTAVDDKGARTLAITAFEYDTSRIALLETRGYQRGGTPYYHFQQPLTASTIFELPESDITVRSLSDETEWEARIELHREVWHPSKVTLEAYRRLRTVAGYRPDLDLVAVTSEGAFASYCICWFDPITRTGEFEPVGTHSTFRRQGFGQAVIREGLRRLQALGATQAIVLTPHSNTASRALYESTGFQIVSNEYGYIKTL